LLLAGTLKLGVLTGTYVHVDLRFPAAQGWQGLLDRLVPYDAAKGEEGVSVQGVVLIALLAAIEAVRGAVSRIFRTAPIGGPESVLV
jgi:hypothetical protein